MAHLLRKALNTLMLGKKVGLTGAGTDIRGGRLPLMMNEPLPILVENSIQIAWDYLERSGELGDPEVASRVLLDAIEMMVLRGERRKLLLSNKAIDAYKRFKAEHRLSLVS
jgi:hypothetical protein